MISTENVETKSGEIFASFFLIKIIPMNAANPPFRLIVFLQASTSFVMVRQMSEQRIDLSDAALFAE